MSNWESFLKIPIMFSPFTSPHLLYNVTSVTINALKHTSVLKLVYAHLFSHTQVCCDGCETADCSGGPKVQQSPWWPGFQMVQHSARLNHSAAELRGFRFVLKLAHTVETKYSLYIEQWMNGSLLAFVISQTLSMLGMHKALKLHIRSSSAVVYD